MTARLARAGWRPVLVLASLGLSAAASPVPVPHPRLLIVGWDGADWDVIDPLLARGESPHLAALIDRGTRAPLAAA